MAAGHWMCELKDLDCFVFPDPIKTSIAHPEILSEEENDEKMCRYKTKDITQNCWHFFLFSVVLVMTQKPDFSGHLVFCLPEKLLSALDNVCEMI